jgi:hypothetical protein
MARNLKRAVAAAVMICPLSGCGSISDETAANLIMSSGGYSAFPCPNIQAEIKKTDERIAELEQLMSVAKRSAVGEVASALAYRTEYIQEKGRRAELAKASAQKQCAAGSNFSSGRSVY